MKVLSDEPIFDRDKFLGFLEVDLQDIISGRFKPLTKELLLKFIPAYVPIASQSIIRRDKINEKINS